MGPRKPVVTVWWWGRAFFRPSCGQARLRTGFLLYKIQIRLIFEEYIVYTIEYLVMTHQDRISILITFVCGIFIGGYLYLTGFLPTYHLPEASTKDAYDGLVVVADAYGGCSDTDQCLSFQLLSDRSYRAVLGTTAEARTYNGSISRSALNDFTRAITETALEANAAVLPLPQCRYEGPGATNYRFLITYNGKNYTLDTCNSQIEYGSILWESLRAIYVEVAESGV